MTTTPTDIDRKPSPSIPLRMRCVECNSGDLHMDQRQVKCGQCEAVYPVKKGIPCFMRPSRYWGNLPKEEMERIVDFADRHGFEAACRKVIPDYVQTHLKKPGRDDGRFFLPIGPDTSVLDLGCMWGGLAIPLAAYAGSVVGLDQTLEALQLAAIRGRDLGRSNLAFIGGEATDIPFEDNQFDVVLLNGVLEWVGQEEAYVCEVHWGKKEPLQGRTNQSPRTLQLKCLQEVLRVLKPGGCLFLAIENRFSFMYFAGRPDDHSGLIFNSLMPRFLADLYSRALLKQPYRAYTYSEFGLKTLLSEAGLQHDRTYTAMNSYGEPLSIFPLATKLLRFYYANFWIERFPPFRKLIFRMIYQFLLATGIARLTPHALVLTALKPGPANILPGRSLEEILHTNWSGLFPGLERPRRLALMKIDGRQEESAPASFLVFADQNLSRPMGYVKVARNSLCRANLEREAELYHTITRLSGPKRLPDQFYYGEQGPYYLLTRQYVEGQKFLFPEKGTRLNTIQTEHLDHYLSKAVVWLGELFRHAPQRFIAIDAFIDRFLDRRLTAISEEFPAAHLPPDLLENYRQTLHTAAPDKIPLGVTHADFNCFNLLLQNDQLTVVDFEYSEQFSFQPFDFLNLCLQTIIDIEKPPLAAFDYTPQPAVSPCQPGAEDHFRSLIDFLRSGECRTSQLLRPHLSTYGNLTSINSTFILLTVPLFILDLLNRQYGDHAFHLRSWQLFVCLLTEATTSVSFNREFIHDVA